MPLMLYIRPSELLRPYWLTCQTAAAHQQIRNYRHHSEIPGPKPKPIFQNTFDMINRKDYDLNKKHAMFKNLQNEFGPIFKIHPIGIPPIVFTASPEDTEAFLRANGNDPIRFAFHALKKVRHADPFFMKKAGILIENGEEWWRVRSRTQTPLAKPGNAVQYIPQLDVVAREFMDIIDKHQRTIGEMPEDFLHELYKFSLEGIFMVNFNRRFGCFQTDSSSNSLSMLLIEAVSTIFNTLNQMETATPWWKIFPTRNYRKLQKAHDEIKRIVVEEIYTAKKNLENKKLDSEVELTLLETYLKTPGLTVQDITTLLMDLTFAGIDTTAHTIAFTLYYLAKNPDVQNKVHEEVDQALGEGKEVLTESHIKKLPYLKSCFRESMRLSPIAIAHIRICTEDIILSGYKVPKGWQACSLSYNISRDEEYFPKALEFIPERWNKDRPLGPILPFASLPFSYGKRMCIGRRISEREMYIFLARAMHRFRVEYKYGDIGFVTKFIGTPEKPLKFEFHSRR